MSFCVMYRKLKKGEKCWWFQTTSVPTVNVKTIFWLLYNSLWFNKMVVNGWARNSVDHLTTGQYSFRPTPFLNIWQGCLYCISNIIFDGFLNIFISNTFGLYFRLIQGGIIFWLRGNLRDVPDILPETALIKDLDGRNCIIMY